MSQINLNLFKVASSASIGEALTMMEKNHQGFILACQADGAVVGLATEGDIRRKLIAGASLKDRLDSCLNTEFVNAPVGTPRELLLKRLDGRIRVIPILDSNSFLVDLVSRSHFPIKPESVIYARSRSPVRISFGGGGSDLTHFFSNDSGAVINTTLSIYSHATLKLRNDEVIEIFSQDLGQTLSARNLEEALVKSGSFGLIQSVLKIIKPEFGFDLHLYSDFPIGSGLGGSAVVAASIFGCFNQFRLDQWDSHEIAELAFQAERLHFGVSGGWQDQYATVFGGFNFMEFKMDQNIIHPLRIKPEVLFELEESLLLCDTQTTHESGDIHEDQKNNASQSRIRELIKENVKLTYEMRDHLLRGRLDQFGKLLDQAWNLKRQFSAKISSPQLDSIYSKAMENGALGGKLIGAGGGGFFIFYVPPFTRAKLVKALESAQLKIRPFRFDDDGLCSWKVRQSDAESI